MTNEFFLELDSVTAFRTLDGVPHSIWTYNLDWSDPSRLRSFVGMAGSIDPGARVALEFSRRIGIRDPKQFSDVPAIQNTSLELPGVGDVQYVYREFQTPPDHPIVFSFIAPSDQDTYCAIKVVHKITTDGTWDELAFKTFVEGDVSFEHITTGPAAVCPQLGGTAPGLPPPILTSETRRVPKCTYVPLNVPETTDDSGRAFVKFGLIKRLALQPGEVDALHRHNPGFDTAHLQRFKAFEGSPPLSVLPSPKAFVNTPVSVLQAFGKAVISLRQQAIDSLHQTSPSDSSHSEPAGSRATTMSLLNAAIVAVNGFEANVAATPIGMLNLERLDMTPVGIERGALIATIPLAPLEKTAVVHKEWSVTTKEFTSIVTDSLENFSQTGVTENTDLATATVSQTTHGNQFNINGTVSGTYGLVTATVATSFASQNQSSDSANESRKHAIATTRQASSRVRQEHKVTISTTTVTGTSETSTRVLENPSPMNPIRIDYFSMMRKWHVGLFRYGLRLTYDIAVPEPGAAMRGVYAQLDTLKARLGPFTFKIAFTDITRVNFPALAAKFQVNVPEPPDDTKEVPFTSPYAVQNQTGFTFVTVTLDLPDGYAVSSATLTANQAIGSDPNFPVPFLMVMHVGSAPPPIDTTTSLDTTVNLDFLTGLSGKQFVVYGVAATPAGVVEIDVTLQLLSAAFEAWQQQVWAVLYNAAQAQYYAEQQELQAQIAALEDKINNVDTLTLRREENEEIMKGVLRWLLGPAFDFMPADVIKIFTDQTTDPSHGALVDAAHGVAFTGNQFGDSANWTTMFSYEEMVKFINEAIEWENVLYFLYSYFWDTPRSWAFIRQIRHSDAIRQAFLRSGSSRVVLTVRKGWEEAWVSFVETGGFGTTLLPGHPYLSIATEIENYDRTNYPGIPPANPGGGPLPDSGASVATESAGSVTPTADPVTITVKSSAGFLVGYTAIIDSFDSGVQETSAITEITDATHITVERLSNVHDGTKKRFPVMQAGERGQLMAEWFEYTPTSGTDIAVTSNLTTIA